MEGTSPQARFGETPEDLYTLMYDVSSLSEKRATVDPPFYKSMCVYCVYMEYFWKNIKKLYNGYLSSGRRIGGEETYILLCTFSYLIKKNSIHVFTL